MGENVLVTGGAGFVGNHLVKRLIKLGFNVTVIDDLSTGKEKNINTKSNFIEGDIRDKSLIGKLSKNCSTIFHLAARVELQKSIINPIDCFSVNIEGTASVIMAALKNKNCRLIFASSCSVYPLSTKKAFSESMSTQGYSPYSISKVTGESMLDFYGKEQNLNYCALRFFNIYGEGQDPESQYAAVIPKFIKRAHANKPLYLNGGGYQTRDFIYIDDVIDCYLKTAKISDTGVFNVGTGVQTSIVDLANLIKEFAPKVVIKEAEAQKGDALSSFADLTKLCSIINFRPKYNLKEGLKLLMKVRNI